MVGVLVGALVVTLGACSSSSSSSPSTPSPATAPRGHGPAVSQLSFTGSKGAAGAVTKVQVSCAFPTLAGPVINLFGTPPTAGQSTMMNVSAGKVHIRLEEGSGTTYRARDFEGTGVSHFDAARGAQIDSAVREVASGGTAGKGGLGAITSIKGTVSCGAQTPGSSTVKITGDTGRGRIDESPQQVRVSCGKAATGRTVTIFAVAQAGNTPTLLVINARVDMFSASVSTPTAFAGFFVAKGKGASAPTSHGVHIDGAAVLTGASGAGTRTLHLVGDATCGSTG
jgi:hypothetical protein